LSPLLFIIVKASARAEKRPDGGGFCCELKKYSLMAWGLSGLAPF